MKKSIFFIALLSILFASCQKETFEPTNQTTFLLRKGTNVKLETFLNGVKLSSDTLQVTERVTVYSAIDSIKAVSLNGTPFIIKSRKGGIEWTGKIKG